MDKKTYYISVQAGNILEDPEAAAFEFEIVASDIQVAQLQDMMDEWSQADSHSVSSMFGYMSDKKPAEARVEEYDEGLSRIYRFIH
ncbi:MAG: hypothetical protein K0R67_3882, partial [Paenibacillus sp.]|nr:hypothetical protein [Paenibacillus sp.]